MLQIDKVQVIDGVTVYGDDNNKAIFYIVPDVPRFRINDNLLPSFSFFKYRMPIDRVDGSKGGGFLVCDVELSLPPEKQEAVKQKLQAQINQQYANSTVEPPEVKIGNITYTRGAAKLNIENISEKFVESAFNPGKPSLYGRNLTPFTVELTDVGATFFEQALQNKGGFVQVSYDLYCPVKLPPIEARIWFSASKFQSFVQDFTKRETSSGGFRTIWRWLFGGTNRKRTEINETTREYASEHQWGGVEIDFKDWTASEEVKQQVRDWAMNSLAEAVKAANEDKLDPFTEEQKKIPDNVTDFHRRISQFKFTNINQRYRESQAVEWNLAPQGMLEPIVNLKDKDGNFLKWEDFATTVDLDDPFFKTLEVPIRVNADFKELPIHSVDVHCEYKQGNTNRIQSFSFTNPDNLEKFKSFIENNYWQYKYWYQVNYKGRSQTFKSPEIETKDKFLTINVDDTGILAVDVMPGDLNWNQVNRAQVKLTYGATPNRVPIERQYVLDANQSKHSLREVVFAPVSEPYRYQVKYFMADGKEYEVSEHESRSPHLFINDPFDAMRTVSLRAAGDLDNDIQTIFVDVRYEDAENQYSQSTTVALSRSNSFVDWTFPVIDDLRGTITYKGTIQLKNNQVETIPETTTTDTTIMVGRKIEEMITVRVLPNLLDFNQLDLAIVSLAYVDAANNINARTELVFDSASQAQQTWVLPLKDRNANQYQWGAVFYLKDGSERTIAPQMTPNLTIPLRVPAS